MRLSISLRKLTDDDLSRLHVWRNDPFYIKYCTWRRQPVGFDDFRAELAADFKSDRHQQAIIRYESGESVGTVFSYSYNKHDGHAFVSTFVEPVWRNSGIGAVAFILFCDLLFSEWGLYKIYTDVYEHNETVIRQLKRGGLTEEGRFKGHRLVGTERHDLLRLALYKDALEPLARRVKRGGYSSQLD